MSPRAQGWPVYLMKQPRVMYWLKERQSCANPGSSSLDSFQTVTITATEVWPGHAGVLQWRANVDLVHGLECSLTSNTWNLLCRSFVFKSSQIWTINGSTSPGELVVRSKGLLVALWGCAVALCSPLHEAFCQCTLNNYSCILLG